MVLTKKEKAIKDLELMAKKLKRRISILEKMDIIERDMTHSIVLLANEYRSIKKDVIEISNMRESE